MPPEDQRDCYLAYGEIATFLSLQTLQPVFSGSQIRESSLYQHSQYLLLTKDNEAHLICEKTDSDILIRGDAVTSEQLLSACRRASAALAQHRFRHRIELYDLTDKQSAYFPYDWPAGPLS